MVLIFLRKYSFRTCEIFCLTRESCDSRRRRDWQTIEPLLFKYPKSFIRQEDPWCSGTQVYLVFQVTRYLGYPSPPLNFLSLAFFESQSLLLNVKVMLLTKTHMVI